MIPALGGMARMLTEPHLRMCKASYTGTRVKETSGWSTSGACTYVASLFRTAPPYSQLFPKRPSSRGCFARLNEGTRGARDIQRHLRLHSKQGFCGPHPPETGKMGSVFHVGSPLHTCFVRMGYSVPISPNPNTCDSGCENPASSRACLMLANRVSRS